jgi:hypothetical protein
MCVGDPSLPTAPTAVRLRQIPRRKFDGRAHQAQYHKGPREDFFTVKKPADRNKAESRHDNIARYKLGAGNFNKYARYELGVTISYSYESGATIESLKDGGAAKAAGLQEGDMILEVDGAPIGVFGDRTYELWRQYIYSKDGEVELLVCFQSPTSDEFLYYYPKIKLDKRTGMN